MKYVLIYFDNKPYIFQKTRTYWENLDKTFDVQFLHDTQIQAYVADCDDRYLSEQEYEDWLVKLL